MANPLLILAQSGMTSEQALGIIIGLTVIVAAAIAAVIVGFFIWRRYTHDEPPVTRETAFTLADLRKLHREGQLSDEEFERTRAAIIAQTRAALARDEPAGNEIDDVPPDKAGDDDEPDGSR